MRGEELTSVYREPPKEVKLSDKLPNKRRLPMRKSIPFFKFMQLIFDEPKHAKHPAQIAQAILKARSIRMTSIASFMPGKMETAYKRITRFLRSCDPKEALWKLFDQKAKFVIADPTMSAP